MPDDADSSSLTRRQKAVEALTGDPGKALLQTILRDHWSPTLHIESCSPEVLKNRLGSRQVVGYRLQVADAERMPGTLRLVAKRYADAEEGERAFRTMQLLRSRGFDRGRWTVPKPICYLREESLLIQEWATGSWLAEAMRSQATSVASDLRKAAGWVAALHREPISGRADGLLGGTEERREDLSGELARRFPDMSEEIRTVSDLIQSRKAQFAGHRGFVHGDYQPENVSVTEEGAVVIDFDQCRVDDPAQDLGTFVAQMTSIGHRSELPRHWIDYHAHAFLEAYLEFAPDEDEESLVPRSLMYVAESFEEIAYYILCVMGERRPRLLSEILQEMSRALQITHLTQVLEPSVVPQGSVRPI